MTESKHPTIMPYIWATLIMFLFGVILIGIVLFLRPSLDPLIVIGVVFAFVSTTSASIAAVMKSHDTYLKVNSQLDAWKRDFLARHYAEGQIAGQGQEQDRVAAQLAASR